MESIRIAVAGVGNCAASLIEGICYYRQHPGCSDGLLFPELSGYCVPQIEVVAAFDVSERKAGQTLSSAIYQAPNNFVRLAETEVDFTAPVYRGPTLDGNPEHLRRFVPESPLPPVDAAEMLKQHRVEILVNLLPTGSHEATEYYARAALDAGCAFINCIPTVLAQRQDFQALFAAQGLPLFGDDVKSQVGTTILHRSLLHMLESRGASLKSSSQINIGGNTDFANFVYRAESKLVSKRKSLKRYVHDVECHVGHHYDPTKGPYKHALIDIDAAVFGGSRVNISVKLESDDKPNSAGTVVDLVRLARAALDRKRSGVIPEACAYYFKSPPVPMDDLDALAAIRSGWLAPA
jgi:myo-inositol-1-phosphate synthase